jgi:methionyl-tRNA formyltransferase
VNWNQSATQIDRQIRGLSPFPGAWTLLGGVRVKLLASRVVSGAGAVGQALDDSLTIACEQGAIQVIRAQKAGKGAQDAQEFLRGTPVPKGTQFGQG